MSFDMGIPANLAAELDHAEGRTAAVESLLALKADGGAASITDLSGTRTWQEILAAFPARDYGIDSGEGAFSGEFGVISPEFSLGGPVAFPAKRDEVVEPVCLPIIIEESKRSLMVGDLSGFSASLASAAVSLHGGGGLTLPVRAPVAIVTAPPTRIVAAGPFVGCPPDAEAFARAEIPVGNLIRLFLDIPLTGVAGDDDATAADPGSMDLLPLGITREAAEWMSREGYVVGATADRLAALGAIYSNHNAIIRRLAA